jgi:hypothetical protein
MTLILSGTDGLSDVDGSAATPAIRGTDANTGIFFPAADTIAFSEGGAEAMRIDSSGNVGIGTSSPSALLHVRKDQTAATYIMADNLGTVNAATSSGFACAEGGSVTAFFRSLRDATGIAQLFNTSASPLTFGTNNTERARIDASGNLLVGTTDASATSGVGIKILSNGRVFAVTPSASDTYNYYNSTVGAYRFYVNAAGTVFATTTTISAISDQRHKENIRDLNVGLSEVMALKPRLFDWKEGKGADTKNARVFIAQEFETVFPDLIDEWKDPAPEGESPYKSVRAELIPVLVKAIQEQQALIQTLTDRITALETPTGTQA